MDTDRDIGILLQDVHTYGAIVPIAPYGLLMTHHNASFIDAINS
jgi:hypothetical protein